MRGKRYQTSEKLSNKFIAKVNSFTNNKYSVYILWQTRKIKSIFKLKDKNQHYESSVIYEGNYSCGESYKGETIHSVEIRTAEHNDPIHNSEPDRHPNNKSHTIANSVGELFVEHEVFSNAKPSRGFSYNKNIHHLITWTIIFKICLTRTAFISLMMN